MPQRSGDWTWFKSHASKKGLIIQYEETSEEYIIYGYDGPEVLLCVIWKGTVPASVAQSYSQAQNNADKTDFETKYKPSANSSADPKNSRGATKVQPEHREGAKLEMFSQNFCDKRTWFTTSNRVTGAAMTDSGDGLTFNLAGGPKVLVDVDRGRVSDGNKLIGTYGAVVYVNGTKMTEHHPDDVMSYDASGNEVFNYAAGQGDYGLNYLTGDVIFKNSQAGNTVTIDYSEVVNSKWYLTPDPGKRIELLAAELQFSEGAEMTSDFIFQARADVGKHPLMAPYLDDAANAVKTTLAATYTWNGTTTVTTSDTSEVTAGEWITLDGSGAYYYIAAVTPNTSVTIVDALGIGIIPSGSTPSAKAPYALFPTGTKLPLGDPTLYRTKFDIIAEANVSYPIIPADPQKPGGGWSWRQLIKNIEIFRWDYMDQAYIGVLDKWGMDIEISLGNDIPPNGWKAVVTFYGLSEDE